MKIHDIENIGSKILRFVIEGEPVAQGRPRFSGRHAYDPPRSREYKEKVKGVIQKAIDKANWQMPSKDMPMKVEMVIYKPMPLNTSLQTLKVGEMGLIAPVKKTGDVENIAKGIMDAATELVYPDDCQVYSLHCEVRYSINPRVEVQIQGMFVNVADVVAKANANKDEEFMELIRKKRERNERAAKAPKPKEPRKSILKKA